MPHDRLRVTSFNALDLGMAMGKQVVFIVTVERGGVRAAEDFYIHASSCDQARKRCMWYARIRPEMIIDIRRDVIPG